MTASIENLLILGKVCMEGWTRGPGSDWAHLEHGASSGCCDVSETLFRTLFMTQATPWQKIS